MSLGSGSNRGRRNISPLRRSHSLDSVVPQADEVLAGILQEVTFSARRNLTDRDWSGEDIPLRRQQRMVDAFDDFGVNLRRHYSFGSSDSWIDSDMFSPRELGGAVTAEVERMRRNFERQNGIDGDGENEQAIGGLLDDGGAHEQRGRLEELRRDYADLHERYNAAYEQLGRTRTRCEELREIVNRRNEEIGAARAAEEAAEQRAVAAEGRAEEAGVERQQAGRELDRGWQRNRRRTNFGEDDYDIDVTLKLIKEFDGNDPTKLEGFLRNCKLVFSRSRERDHPYVLELILTNKLTDRAMRDLKYKDIETMEQLEVELEALYGTTKSIASLQLELSNLRQKEAETVSSYGSRAERLTAELAEELSKAKETRAEKRIVQDTIRECAKASFENGLHGPLQVLVRSRNFKTLHESVMGAIDLAKTTNFQAGKSRNSGGGKAERVCFKCNLPGHFARGCPVQQAPSAAEGGKGRSIMQFGSVCKFCRYAGHEALDCHKLKRRLGIPEGQSIFTGTSRSNASKKNQGANAGSSNQDDVESLSRLPVGAFQIA